MTRENVDSKARRLLVEGRLSVLFATESLSSPAPIVATCRGDSGEVYRLGYDARKKEWRCGCQARGRCSHTIALQLVTTIPRRPE